MASTQRVSVEDAEALYRRLRQISELLDRLPPFGEIMAFGGARDFMIPAVAPFAQKLEQRGSELGRSLGMLEANTQQKIVEIRTSVQKILDADALAEATAKNLSAETDRGGSNPDPLRGR